MNILFFKLLFAHFLADFIFQTEKMAKEKAETYFSQAYWNHILIHGVCYTAVFAHQFMVVEESGVGKVFFSTILLTSLHAIIDLTKTFASKRWEKYNTLFFLLDQALHIITLGFISYKLNYTAILKDLYAIELPWNILAAYLFVTVPVGIIMKVLLKRWTPQSSQIIQDAYDNTMEVEIDLKENDPKRLEKKFKFQKNTKFQNDRSVYASLVDAGQWIGILERILILTFVLNGDLRSIGFLLTAKSVFRFGDLKGGKDRQMTEYILIGTLISFSLAIFTGLLCLGGDALKVFQD
ncbi:DUF3307 domain-containing protein [Flammeovirga yaeyamensis]|uniref:DUF3307 domain-containing protein n=2 Tax=Flammeovirga yaeyamensis TaxID=367791 RepID=A0AAX1NB62_9BACT|nr:DUF3307 domain-containing protein [Flammeovirga yaeyamensis]NMF33926.1 DUF3307 domain-containing protein [Flammeovirga yaeyamensis]QWG04814.1 DUF3307 domain-containing protein [Flammeovirga yaeyamensis]